MRDTKEIIQKIRLSISGIRKIKHDIAIIIVANVKPKNALTNDFVKHSMTTEFYAEREHEEIITGFRENGFYVQFFNNEIDFIKWVIEGGYKRINKNFKTVYNAANSGTGPGKKSLIPAFCNLNNIPITGSNPYVVGLCRHKFHYSAILNNSGLNATKSWYYHKDYQWLLDSKPTEGIRVIAKPTYESASIGVDSNSIFEYSDSYEEKLKELSAVYKQPITVQEFIPGYEVEVPIMIQGGIPSALGVVGLSLENAELLADKVLTYDIVYNDLYNFYAFDKLGQELNNELCKCAENAMRILGTEGFGRIDFRITKEGKYSIIDASTYPHIIKHSSFWYLFREMKFDYRDLFALLISITSQKYDWS